MNRAFLLVTVVGVLSALGARAAGPDYLSDLSGGLVMVERGRLADARDRFDSAAEADLNDSLVHLAQGLLALEEGDSARARPQFERALSLATNSTIAILGLGFCDLTDKQLSAAKARFEQVIARDPANGAALAAQAYVELANGRFEQVAELAEQALGNGANRALCLEVQGISDLRQARATKAVKMLSEADVLLHDTSCQRSSSALALGAPPAVRAKPPSPSRTDSPRRLEIMLPGERPLRGRVTVGASYIGSPRPTFVSFRADGMGQGICAQPPYAFIWDTSKLANGEHTITFVAYDSDRRSLAEVSQVISVASEAELDRNRYDQTGYAAVSLRIQDLLAPRANPLAVSYNLGVALVEAGRPREALALLETAFATEPHYPQLRERLTALYRSLGMLADTDRDIRSVPTQMKAVALTFDDGPLPITTPHLLEILRRYDAKGTFFVVGLQVQSYQELARQIAAEGHELANHSYTHNLLDGLSRVAIQHELLRCQVQLRTACGPALRFFRPPGGHYNSRVRSAGAEVALRPVLWSHNWASYLRRYGGVDAGVRRLLNDLRPGSIVLMHHGNNDHSFDALPKLLEGLKQRGWGAVTVSQLMGRAS